jgi:hypothetical protein
MAINLRRHFKALSTIIEASVVYMRFLEMPRVEVVELSRVALAFKLIPCLAHLEE